MKLSELIEKLNEIHKEHGDLILAESEETGGFFEVIYYPTLIRMINGQFQTFVSLNDWRDQKATHIIVNF